MKVHLKQSSISGAAYVKVVCTLEVVLEREVFPIMCAKPTSQILADSKSPDSSTLPLLMSLCRICRRDENDLIRRYACQVALVAVITWQHM